MIFKWSRQVPSTESAPVLFILAGSEAAAFFEDSAPGRGLDYAQLDFNSIPKYRPTAEPDSAHPTDSGPHRRLPRGSHGDFRMNKLSSPGLSRDKTSTGVTAVVTSVGSKLQ